MIHYWMTEEMDDFYNTLLKIRSIVAKPILSEEEQDLLESHASYNAVWGKPGSGSRIEPAPKAPTPSSSAVQDDDSGDEVIDVSSAPAKSNGYSGSQQNRACTKSADTVIKCGP